MHTCPDCGQACYCHGDIDDIEIESEADECVHDCDDLIHPDYVDIDDFGDCE